MPTSKLAIVERDNSLRGKISRELLLATLTSPSYWEPKWRPLLLVHLLLRYVKLPSLEGHPYIYERWWSYEDGVGDGPLNMKLLMTNPEGTSMVLVGTSAWEPGMSTARWVC
jgi:hypothetical protein